MVNIKELSTENIRSRMVKNAARIWGIESEDIESTFDPIVAMLIEACAFELSKINNEIHDSQSRILEKLAQVLSPEIYTGTQPSHAIAHARASEPEALLRRDTQFYAQQKILNQDQKEVLKDIYFSPAKDTYIFDSAVKFMAIGKSLFEYRSPNSKHVIEGTSNDSLEPYHVWIGLELNSHINSLDNFSFFIDWKNVAEKNDYLQLLPLAKWFYNNEEIEVNDGMKQNRIINSESSIANQYDISYRSEQFVESFYEKNFVTINSKSDKNIQLNIEKYPAEFENVFSEKVLEKLEGKFAWIKIVFPGAIKINSLSDLYISMNSFPVVNRKLNKITYQLRSNLNIIPLTTNEYFLDIVNLQNSEGAYFKSNPLESGFKNDAGFYTLRYGGIERFDKRSATEFLQSTIELLRDESASFSSLGNDFIGSYISQINQSIAMIENRLSSKGEYSKPSHFIIVNPIKQNENVFVKFWSTNGLEGNGIKANAKLSLNSGGEVKSNTSLLLTSTFGGRKALNDNEKISAFRRSIITHDRIVTQEDIVSFCYNELGNIISKVTLDRNWAMSPLPNQGFIRIIEVIITPKTMSNISNEEWGNIIDELKVKLENASNKLIPINVKVKI